VKDKLRRKYQRSRTKAALALGFALYMTQFLNSGWWQGIVMGVAATMSVYWTISAAVACSRLDVIAIAEQYSELMKEEE